MNNTYTIIDINGDTDEVVAENQTLDDLRMFANDLFWQDDGMDFSNASINSIKALLGCDYGILKTSFEIGEVIHNGELVSVWEDEDGYYIEIGHSKRYIDVDDYEIMKY